MTTSVFGHVNEMKFQVFRRVGTKWSPATAAHFKSFLEQHPTSANQSIWISLSLSPSVQSFYSSVAIIPFSAVSLSIYLSITTTSFKVIKSNTTAAPEELRRQSKSTIQHPPTTRTPFPFRIQSDSHQFHPQILIHRHEAAQRFPQQSLVGIIMVRLLFNLSI